MGITEALNNLNMAVNPQGAELKNNINNQNMARSSLQQMADERQTSSPDQIQPNGTQVPMNPAMQRLLMIQKQNSIRQGMAFPSPEAMQTANQSEAAINDPYYNMKMMMNLQQEQAKIEQTKADAAQKRTMITETPHGPVAINLDTGQQIQVGEPKFASPEVQKLHDLQTFQKMHNSGAYNAPSGAADQTQQGYNGISDQIIAATSADPEGKAKAMQDADQAVIESKNARDLLLPTLNHMDDLNNSGNLPQSFSETQGEASNLLHSARMTNGATADAIARFEQLNSGNFTKGVSQLFSLGGNLRMEKPIAEAVGAQMKIPMNIPQKSKASMAHQLRVSAYNTAIAAQNKAALIRNPNAKTIPEIPLDFKGKIYTMQEIQNAAAAKKMTVEDAIKKVQAAGSMVVN